MKKNPSNLQPVDMRKTTEKAIKMLEGRNSYFITSIYFSKQNVNEVLIPLLKISSKLKFKEKLYNAHQIFSFVTINSLKSTLNKLNQKFEVKDEPDKIESYESNNSSDEVSSETQI